VKVKANNASKRGIKRKGNKDSKTYLSTAAAAAIVLCDNTRSSSAVEQYYVTHVSLIILGKTSMGHLRYASLTFDYKYLLPFRLLLAVAGWLHRLN
jgi:uncharacterized protein (DUF2252 family)